ncbi:hypothetical protein KSP39_PZI010556 [Platanthera zijinensis]|uniref:Uncharacterized protein n=1 Tax=Platanthera zijinensis TaxID=2320716 RepID=A0AAP0BIB2_9ASPA
MEGSRANGFSGGCRTEGVEKERLSQGMEISGSGRGDNDDGLIGAYVRRTTSAVGRFLLGKVVSYDGTSRVFRITYEDGHHEDLGRESVRSMLKMDSEVGSFPVRKRRLDRLVHMGGLNRRNTRSRKGNPDVPASFVQVSSEDVSVDADSSSDSCDHARVPAAAAASSSSVEEHVLPLKLPPSPGDNAVPDCSIFCSVEPHILALEAPRFSGDITVPEGSISFSVETHALPLELPPSSGDIAVPEGSISYLFSTYNFLRSFSLQLFLSPFGFDDYVGSLNCSVQNFLMDSIHLSLMRALSRHLQALTSDGSNLASKCLRLYDWTLLDMLTWPAFLVEYLFVMGYFKDLDSKDFIDSVLNGEYYCLTVATKLKVLQLLCDDAINSSELRTELGMRAGTEEDREDGLDVYLPSHDPPTTLHLGIPKTIGWKEDTFNGHVPENQHVNCLVSEHDCDGSANSQDKNNDECRLCGMDGTLICCDGCPSAYHSRCIGLNKASLPEGLWFCPECSIIKIEPTSSRIGRGTSGAAVLGTDAHGHIFVGTCNYLLILGTSLNEGSVSRYYNQDDILKVLSVISSSPENALFYADINKSISEYFDVPTVFPKLEKSDSMRNGLNDKDGVIRSIDNTLSRMASNILSNSGDNSVSNIMTRNSKHDVAKDDGTEDAPSPSIMDLTRISDAQTIFKDNHDMCPTNIPVIAGDIFVSLNNGNPTSAIIDPKIFLPKEIDMRVKHGFGSVVTDLSCSNLEIAVAKSIFVNNFSSSSGNGSEICKEEADNSIYSTKNGSAGACYEIIDPLNKCDMARNNAKERGSAATAPFKPQAYINQYAQGDIAASAAASLAVLSTKDSKFTGVNGSCNQRKILSANIALQLKAFSVAVMNFLWPWAEKKLTDIPRERCGWCIACKSLTTSKKGCLLNLAASNAIKGPIRYSNLRASKHHENHLPVIATQLMVMEESLRGLMVGEFLDARNDKWRKQVRQASSCGNLKSLVLQLEKNIRGIAFSREWTRKMDDLIENKKLDGISRTGGNKKHGKVGRPGKKQSELMLPSSDDACNDLQWGPGKRGNSRRLSKKQPEDIPASSDDNCNHLQLWRGGKLSKTVLQTGTIPSSLAKIAARQGGRKTISGISYHECISCHRRSRQFAWRAAVETCRSISQLALQIRHLDAHIRWKEFTRMEQVPVDIKGSETNVMVFRNAFICDKRILENCIIYALNFGDQKHLPVRITKTVLESEKEPDGNEKFWFSEDDLPLYLIKEYEEKVGTRQILPAVSAVYNMAKFYRRQLKYYWGDVFSYLACKQENPGKCPFCDKDVCLRYAVKCKSCEDYCHLDCSEPSVSKQNDDPTFCRICKLCYSMRSPEQLESGQKVCSKKSLLLRRYQMPGSGMTSVSQIRPCSTSISVCKTEVNSNSRSSDTAPISEGKTKRSGGKWVTHGIVWRRKKHDTEAGKEFLMKNIIFKAKKGSYSSKRPTCCLCEMPYNSNLMYVCCENCNNWSHADAVLLDESKILDVVGFKCCKCRRKSSPVCPYSVVGYTNLEKLLEHDNAVEIGHDLQIQLKSGSSTTSVSISEAEDFDMVESDPLLHSFEQVEPVDEITLEMEDKFDASIHSFNGHQKLCVRRSQVNQMDIDELYAIQMGNPSNEASTETLQNILATNPTNISLEWDNIDIDGHVNLDLENTYKGESLPDHEVDIAFEPQTYFSFTELLASVDEESMPNHQDVPITLNDYGGIYDDMPCHNLKEENDIIVSEEFTFDGLECQICKLYTPAPDLICDICRLCIHFHCSPWVEESTEISTGSKWRCGNCQEWR